MGFKEMKMMKSTEPSVDEVGKGMKQGGKPKMQMGGALPMVAKSVAKKRPMTAAQMAAARPRGAALTRSAAMSRPAPGIPPQAMGRVKNGGSMKKVEKEIRNEKEELHRVDQRLNRHEEKAASKAHKGLKTGGVMKKYATGGGLSGGLSRAEEMKNSISPDPAGKTKKMMSIMAEEMRDSAQNMKRLGPQPTEKEMEMMKSAIPKRKGGIAKYATGGLIQKYKTGGVVNGAAGYKDGGHCAMKEGGEAGFKANKKSCSW
jgi:hypothetical protein